MIRHYSSLKANGNVLYLDICQFTYKEQRTAYTENKNTIFFQWEKIILGESKVTGKLEVSMIIMMNIKAIMLQEKTEALSDGPC